MPQLIDPTLDLFLYDPREGLGELDEKIKSHREHFKAKLASVPAPIVAQIDEFDQKGESTALFGRENGKTFPFEGENQSGKYEGYLWPTRLADSYGLLIDCSYLGEKSTEHLSSFVPDLKQIIEDKLNGEKATLGQTWVFYAVVADSTLDKYDIIAQTCYKALIPNANWLEHKTSESEFSEGKLFELWQESGEMTHVVIILFNNTPLARTFMTDHLNENQLHWFQCRHKITWAHSQSRQLKQQLKEGAVEIDGVYRNVLDQKEKIEAILESGNKVLHKYYRQLYDFGIQIQTIGMNLHNYQEHISKLHREIAGLQLSDKFEQRVKETYLPQLQREYAVFASELEVIKNLISTIQVRETAIQAQETARNTHEIVKMQRKVEWLEVFFASYYAAVLVHYISKDFCFSHDYSKWSIVGWAIIAPAIVLVTLVGLRNINLKEWFVLGGVTLLAVVWFVLGYCLQ